MNQTNNSLMNFHIIIPVLAFLPPSDVAGSYDERCIAVENLSNIKIDIVFDQIEDRKNFVEIH